MTAIGKDNTYKLLALMQLLSFSIKNAARNRNKRTLLGKVKKTLLCK